MVRLIVVSNRVAVPGHHGQSRAGGLAVAIRPVLRRHPGIWFGWSGQVAAAPEVKVHMIQHGHQTYVLIDLGQEDYHEYYNGYANKVLCDRAATPSQEKAENAPPDSKTNYINHGIGHGVSRRWRVGVIVCKHGLRFLGPVHPNSGT